MINPVTSAAYRRSREVLWRLPNRRSRRPPSVSRRFQCRMTFRRILVVAARSGECPLPNRCAQGTWAASFPNSSGKYARTVVVRTLPRDAKPTASLVIASSSLGLKVFVSCCHTFDRSRALVGPIQVADEKHGSPPFSEFTNASWRKRHASLECVRHAACAR